MSALAREIVLRLGMERWNEPQRVFYGPGHALLLSLLRAADPAFATALHDEDRRKPLSVGPLAVTPRGSAAEVALRVTAWDETLVAQLERALERALLLQTEVRGHTAILLDVRSSKSVSLETMWEGPSGSSLTVRFCSPTMFSLGRRLGHQQYCLLPDPALVVRSWLRPWMAAHGPLPEGFDVQGDIEGHLTVRTVRRLQTEVVNGQKTALTGFTGEVVYAWAGPEPEGRQLLSALGRFAEYCGTGAKTAHGFGQTRVLEPEKRT